MDDLILNSCKSNLLSLKGKDWSSLQNLDIEDSEETSNSDTNYHQNGCLNLNRISLVNGSSEYTSDDSSLPVQHHDTTKLKKDDMSIYGLRPGYDEFYLVICEHCGKVYKPQALSRHIQQRHSKKNNHNNNVTNESNSHSLDRQIRSEESSSMTDDDFNRTNHNLCSLLSTSSTSLLAVHSTSKDDLDLEKFKHKQQQQSLIGLKSHSNSNSATGSPLNQPTSDSLITKITKHKLLPLKDRKYDPDKHCGVQVPPSLTPCTRSLTCKTHSLTLRRSVQGRRDSFDNLLNEHRSAKEAALRAAGVEVKPTKLQLKQQQRLLKNNLLKEQQQQKDTLEEQTIGSSLINASITSQPQQFKIHFQSSNSTTTPSPTISSPFKAFNQMHSQPQQQLESTSIYNKSTVLQSPNSSSGNSSFVNMNNLQFTSPSSTVKQFTFGTNQQLGKLLSSPSRPTASFNNNSLINSSSLISSPVMNNNNQQQHTKQPLSTTGILSSSIQVINRTNQLNNNHLNNNHLNNNHLNEHHLSTTSINGNRIPFNCDINPATINHYPKPAAVCTFNERRLSIFTQSSNKQILSSKLFNRKQDNTYSALSILCNKAKQNDSCESMNEHNQTPIKQPNAKKHQRNRSNSLLCNSQSNSRTDYYSSNSNSQESFGNVLSSPSLNRKSSIEFSPNYLYAGGFGVGGSKKAISGEKESADQQFNSVNTSTRMNY